MNVKRFCALFCALICTATTFSACFSTNQNSTSSSSSSSSSSETVDSSSSAANSSSNGPTKYDVTFVYDKKTENDGKIDKQLTVSYPSPLTSPPATMDNSIIGWTTSPKIDYNMVEFPMELTEDVTLYAVRQSDFENYLPVIHVDTNNSSISATDVYTPATITLENTEEKYEFNNLSAGIRLRGNSTKDFAKKPYRIKFDQKISMFGEIKHKSWVLLAMYLDASLIRDYLGHSLARKFDGLEVASCSYHVELYINGNYQGVYLLCDQVEEQKDSRIPVEIDENELRNRTDVPFIIEKNQVRSAAQSQYPYDWFECNGTQYTIKYPENPTKAQYDYIVGYYKTVEQAVIEGDYDTVESMVDLKSVYDWFLLNELLYNFDAVQLSGFMYKTVDGKMKFGPAWDFDNSFLRGYTGLVTTKRDISLASRELFTTKSFRLTWMEYMFQHPIFKAEYCTRWKELRYPVLDAMEHIQKYRLALRPAAERNLEVWYQNLTTEEGQPYVPDNKNIFEDQYDFIERFLNKRFSFFRGLYIPYSV